MPTDDSVQNNAGQLGGPVIILEAVLGQLRNFIITYDSELMARRMLLSCRFVARGCGCS